MGLLSAVQGRRTYLDTNVFIYALEAYAEFASELTSLFAALDRAEVQAVTSELTLAETLVKPFMDRREDHARAYQEALRTTGGLLVRPVTRDVLVEAARVRATSGVRLPDAIHAATAALERCEVFLTNDQRLRGLAGLSVLLPSEVAHS